MATTSSSSPVPGYFMTVAFGGAQYQIFAYTEDATGAKTYLPSHADHQVLEKIKKLTQGLLKSHEARSLSQHEAPYGLKTVDGAGLTKTDNTVNSHDFLIQPIEAAVATDMAAETDPPMQAAAVKAQNVWDTMERLIQAEMGRPAPVTMAPAAAPAANPPAATAPAPNPQPAAAAPSAPAQAAPAPHPARQPVRQRLSAIDMATRSLNLDDANWYNLIPNRVKLRIIDEILEMRAIGKGGVYEMVWKYFDNPGRDVIPQLKIEKQRLTSICNGHPLTIPPHMRHAANQVIEAFHQNSSEAILRGKIQEFMEFLRNEAASYNKLLHTLYQFAIAEGVRNEDEDREWAQHHYIDDSHRFVQALAYWLDSQ